MRDQNWFRGMRVAGFSLGAALLAIAGCGSDTDVFSAEEWKRVKLVEPLGSAMPANPYVTSDEGDLIAKLGQKLFYEKAFSEGITVTGPSGNMGETGKVGCVSCHGSQYFSESRSIPISHGRNWSSRNTGAMVNLGWYTWTLWTGTFDSMVAHGSNVWGTSASPLAQAHFVYKKYRDDYNAAFPATPLDPALDSAAPDAARFPATGQAKANASAPDGAFEKMTKADQWAIHQFRANMGRVFDAHPRKLVTRNSALEKYIRGTDRSEQSFSTRAKNGLKLFIGKASCIDCHNGPILSDNQFHNIGVPTAAYFPPGTTTAAVQDKGRMGTLPGLVNTALATLRTNDQLEPMDQLPVFSGAGQFSNDPVVGRKRITDLEEQFCVPGGRSEQPVRAICAGLFKAPREANPAATPPVVADPGDPRFQICVDANIAEGGLCATVDETKTPVVITGNFDPRTEGAFRTPQLINVAETGPYFHNGEVNSLREVVVHYNNGGGPSGTFAGIKSPRVRPLGLTDTEIDDLVEFLKTLTGEPPAWEWACNPLVGPPAGCGPEGAGATGGASGGGGAGGAGGGGGGGGRGGSAGNAGSSGTGGAPAASGGAVGTGGASASGGAAATGGAGTGGDSGGGASGGAPAL